eukprot:scaffold6317_cov98-Phaeocystis_antarctica.AAC.11
MQKLRASSDCCVTLAVSGTRGRVATRGLAVQSGRSSPSKSPASSSGAGVEHGTCQSQKGGGQLVRRSTILSFAVDLRLS